MNTENNNLQAKTSQIERVWKPMKPYKHMEKEKPQGLYPTKDSASKEQKNYNTATEGSYLVFPKLVKTPKDEAMEKHSLGMTCTPPQKQGDSQETSKANKTKGQWTYKLRKEQRFS